MGEVNDYLRSLARARAATSAGRWADAGVLWERLAATNPVNGDLWYRLAEARFALEDYGGALSGYETALRLGVRGAAEPVFPAELAYQVARCLARLGDRDQALAALAEAAELGYRDLDRARTDEHLESVRASARFAEIVGSDVDGLSRDEGWRHDLGLLAREVRRRRGSAPLGGGTPPRFDAAVADLDAAIPGLSDAQVTVELMKLVATLGDGHASVEAADETDDFHRELPVQFFQFVEGLFVTAAQADHARLVGGQVLAVDRTDVDDALARLAPVISRDNEQWLAQVAPILLRQLPLLHALGVVADPGQATLTLRLLDGSTVEQRLSAATDRCSSWAPPCPPGWVFLPDTLPPPLPLYLRNCGAYYWYDVLAEQRLVYFQLNGIGEDPVESLDEFCGRLFDAIERAAAEKLVIDLRWNSGGNTFLVLPLLHRLIGCTQVNQPGRLFVIIGRKTFSAAQNTATLIERHTHAVFVGEPTGSSPNFVGETTPFSLPYSGLQANVSDLYWQTSWPMDHRTWIAPHLYTPPEFAAYRANRDPAMDAILASQEHTPGW